MPVLGRRASPKPLFQGDNEPLSDAHVTQATCAVCLDPLCRASLAVLQSHEGRRSCRHIFHTHCLRQCPVALGCPLCRTPYVRAKVLPHIRNSEAWFAALEPDFAGRLETQIAVDALCAGLPVDMDALFVILPTLQLGGWVSFEELIAPGGLLRTVRSCLLVQQESSAGKEPLLQEAGFRGRSAMRWMPASLPGLPRALSLSSFFGLRGTSRPRAASQESVRHRSREPRTPDASDGISRRRSSSKRRRRSSGLHRRIASRIRAKYAKYDEED